MEGIISEVKEVKKLRSYWVKRLVLLEMVIGDNRLDRKPENLIEVS
jgi:hypothetical protein